jgi:hypothetical protein
MKFKKTNYTLPGREFHASIISLAFAGIPEDLSD